MLSRLSGPVVASSVALTLLAAGVTAASAAEGDASPVSRLTDSRIEESSGLAASVKHDDLVYTINDKGADPLVYAVKVSTGETVGTTRVGGGSIEDTESIAVDPDGTVWLSDLGDNDAERGDVAIYAFPEQGPGDHAVTAKRYPVSYPGGPVDVEALLVHPETGEKFLASKVNKSAGTIYSLPAELSADGNTAKDLGLPSPVKVTDGAFSLDGSEALFRTNDAVHVYDASSWKETRVVRVPEVEQGESITVEPSGTSFLIGSEGEGSPLIRVAYDAPSAEPEPTDETPGPTPSPAAEAPAEDDDQTGSTALWIAVGVALLAALGGGGAVLLRRRG